MTSVGILTDLSVAGNVNGGNLFTSGVVSATTNVTGGNIVVSGDDITDTNGRVNINSALDTVDFAVNGTAANVLYVSASSNTVSIGSSTQVTGATLTVNTTDAVLLPVGNTAQRPSGQLGMIRFNTSLDNYEQYGQYGWNAIGNPAFTLVTNEQFNGDGSTVSFTLVNPGQSTNSCMVSINGVVQMPVTAYAVVSNVLTFTEAPAPGDVIDVREFTTTTTVTSISNATATAIVAVEDGVANVDITGSLVVDSGTGYIYGDGTYLTNVGGGNVIATKLVNGNSLVNIAGPGGEVYVAVNGANVFDIGEFAVTTYGNFIPSSNATQTLGNATNWWKSLYVSGNTIYIGGANLQVSNGNMTLGGQQVVIANATGTTTTTGNVSVTGNVTGGNLASGGRVDATGNVNGGNLRTVGLISATGTITGGSLIGNRLSANSGTFVGNLYVGSTANATAFSSPAIVAQGPGGAYDQVALINTNSAGSADFIAYANNGTDVQGWMDMGVTGNAFTDSNYTITRKNDGYIFANGVPGVGGNLIVATGSGGGSANSDIIFATNGFLAANEKFRLQNSTNTLLPAANATLALGSSSKYFGNAFVTNVTAGGLISATGTVTGGNLATGGTASATGTITGGNLATGGTASATGTITGGNINTGGSVSATGAVTGGNVLTDGIVSALGNIITGGNINATSNVTGGNLLSSGLIYTSGTMNVTGNTSVGNLTITGLVNATGNITTTTGNVGGGNLLTTGIVSATGNITGGNVNTNNLVGTGVTVKSTGALTLSATGNISVNSTYINSLLDPVQAQDAATKNYVDAATSGLHVHTAANAATTGTLATATGGTVSYNNGSSGVGANLVTTGSFTTIDGVNIASVGARILVKNEANAVWNGVYTYSNATVIVRATDFDTTAEVAGGDFLFIISGTQNGDTGWVQTTDNVVIGTSNIVFTQFSGAGTYTAGAGLTLTGQQFSVNVDNTTTAIVSGNVVVKTGATLTTPNIGAATGTSLSVTGNVSSNYFIGNGSALTGLSASKIFNGTSEANIGASNGNANITINGTSNVVVVASTGTYTTGLASVTGNVIGGNITTAGQVSATGNITGGNLSGTSIVGTLTTATQTNITSVGTLGSLTVTANVTGGNVLTGGIVSATGNITGGNLSGTSIVGTLTTATQTNITSVGTLGSLTVTANVTGGNILTGGLISATGNITSAANISGSNLIGTIATASQTSITAVGTLTSLSVTGNVTSGNLSVGTGTITGGNIVNSNANGVGNIGSATTYFNTVFAKATSAQYADLAEKYTADAAYEPGTVVSFGGAKEVTITASSPDRRVAGVVSTNPSYIMNGGLEAEFVATVALTGRVPTKVVGPVRKGDLMVSAGNGQARADTDPQVGTVIGKALEDFDGVDGVIEVVVGRF